MQKAVDAGAVVGDPVVFAENQLQIIVGEGNPEGVAGLADLSSGDLVVALCAPEVPCGRYAAQVFENAGLPLPTASQEENVRAVVEKVSLGEADAGIGYTTDVLARSDEVDGVDIPADQNVIATYPVAELNLGSNPDAGRHGWRSSRLPRLSRPSRSRASSPPDPPPGAGPGGRQATGPARPENRPGPAIPRVEHRPPVPGGTHETQRPQPTHRNGRHGQARRGHVVELHWRQSAGLGTGPGHLAHGASGTLGGRR